MLTKNQDNHKDFRKIRMEFMNPPHLEDCLAHCRQHGIQALLEGAFAELRNRAAWKSLQGEETWIRVTPTSRTQPVFSWMIHAEGKLLETGRINYSEIMRVWTLVPD